MPLLLMQAGLARGLRLAPALACAALLAWHGCAAAQPRPVAPRGALDAEERATIALFERARDSVVFISTRQQVRDFWSRNVFTVPRGQGSGFVWDDAGHVVTNFHVIQGASGATVRLADGRDHPAQLVGVSPAHDIAVLRITVKAKPPPPVPLGSSDDLRVGQRVYAIGNPFGLDWSLTTGVVSALDRSLPTDSGINIEHLIQTDAAINPGNSGGPLLDSAGRLIGMNTAIYSPSGASAGIGFAVPADTINRVVPQLIRTGKYARPVLGIEADESVNQRLARQYKVRGVVILKVAPNSAAAKAGLRAATIARDGSVTPGDIIVEIQGERVESVGRLIGRLDDFKVGETIRLGVLRNGAKVEVRATLQAGN
jgi:S1-C subfamily serine protease